jgi:hypothetical protein
MYLMYPHTAGLIVHVCGILVGLAYLRRRTILRTLGLESMLSSASNANANTANTGGSGYRWHRANSGGAGNENRAGAQNNRGTPGSFFRRRANANAANLEPGTRIALAGLNAAAMNGKRGVVKGPDVNNGARVNVVLDGGQTFSVKPENCVVVR